jgi:hypothetical protein
MRTGLTEGQIKHACRELLEQRRHVTVRDVQTALRDQHGAVGRSARIAATLKAIKAETPVAAKPSEPIRPIPPDEATRRVLAAEKAAQRALAAQHAAESRATLAEQREVSHQDYWADRAAEKMDEVRQAVVLEYEAKLRKADQRISGLLRKVQELSADLQRRG